MKPEFLTATGRKRSFGRTCRIFFRRFRITIWLLVLALLGALIYLTQVGLPDFAKRPLLENLRARGLELQFSRLRLSWYYGIVAENVRFGRAEEPLGPGLTAARVQLRLDRQALTRLQFQVDSLWLRRGRLVWPVAETNEAPRQLTMDNIQAELRFLPDDEWALDHFTADFAGAKLQLSGTVANASAVRAWRLLKVEQAVPAGTWRHRLREFADTLERIRFSAPPALRLDVRGDARDLASFGVHALVVTPGADTPWGTVHRGRFNARIYAATTNGLSSADLSLEAGEARTRWAATQNLQVTARVASFESLTNLGNGDLTLCAGRVETEWGVVTNVQLTLHGAAMEGQTNLINADLALRAERVATPWGSATNAQFEAQWFHVLTNAIPLVGEGKFHCSQPNTKWAAARQLKLNLRLVAPSVAGPLQADESWAGWARLEPYALDWESRLDGLQSRGLEIEDVVGSGNWRAPELTITGLQAKLHQRRLEGHARLNVATRALDLGLVSDIDPHQLLPLISEEARRWLAACEWPQPPELKGKASLVLPAWTNRQPDWHAEVRRTLQLQGEVKFAQGGAYREVSVTGLQSHLFLSNLVWRLSDLTVTRPEGTLEAELEADERAGDFWCRISSTLDLRVLRPLLDSQQQKGLDYFTFTEPPVIDVEIWGCGQESERVGIRGRVALTNFTFRGESASSLQTALQYTNRILQFTHPRIQRGTQLASADGLCADFVAQKVYLTNGFSTTEPLVIARAIGAHVARAIEPYQFQQPPVARVHGIIPMHGEDDADLHFDLDGGPFDWWRFHVPRIVGHVHWLGQHLTLSNVWVDFYGGQAAGSAGFDFHPRQETDYHFAVAVTNAILPLLVKDLFEVTNRLEGRLWGTLMVTNANTVDLQTWQGHGNLNLRDGLIWEIPIFGIFSGVLNSMVPGLGNSRASAGTCTFVITNGIIRSDNLDITSTGAQLQYRGTLDFQGQVNARVAAGLLRDTWLVGPVVSTVFWPVTKLFEYKVAGSLGNPKAEPVYLLPKVVLLPFQLPFHPLRTLRELFPEDLGVGRTNAAPLSSPKQTELEPRQTP